MELFELTFGVPHMKYSVHLISHLHLVLQYFGPLTNVACYGPEDQIGKITRNVLSMSNTTTNLMNNYTILNETSTLLAAIVGDIDRDINSR